MLSGTPARVVALVALLIASTQAPDLAGSVRSDFSSAGDKTAAQLELEPVSGDVPGSVLTGAAALMPDEATYQIVVGNNLELSPSTRASVEPLLRYWLLPRRSVPVDPDWVIAYGASTETLGLPLGRQVEVAPGVVVAEVARG